MAQQLQVIQETYIDDIQDLLEKISIQSKAIEKKGSVLKRRRDLLLTSLKDLKEGDVKLGDSKVSCTTSLYSSIQDDSEQTLKLQEEITNKENQIQELREKVDQLTAQLKNTQVCNEEMQYQLQQKQKSQFSRTEKPSQSIIVPKFSPQTEKAANSAEKLLLQSPNSVKSIDSQNPKDRKSVQSLMRRVSLQAAVQAHLLSVKGDYTTLQNSHDELLSAKSNGSQKSFQNQ